MGIAFVGLQLCLLTLEEFVVLLGNSSRMELWLPPAGEPAQFWGF